MTALPPDTASPARPKRGNVLRRIFAPVGAALSKLASAGTHGYPPEISRRLKILNMIAALIVISTLIFALQQILTDFEKMAPVIYINLALAVIASLVPFSHRISELAGGLILVVAEMVALFGFAAYFGRSGGTPIMYIAFSAAPFVVFGLKRIRLILAVVAAALVLHLYTWFSFHRSDALLTFDDGFLKSLYIQAAITTFGLISASVYYAFSLAERAKAETDAVLRNVLPDSVVERLKAEPNQPIADSFTEASVLFADVSGFVKLARELGPARTVGLLNMLVSAFDQLAERHGVEKIKTIGDAYMAAAGVPEPAADHAERLGAMALDMLETAERIAREADIPLRIRIGMAAGPLMAGVIGTRKFSYDVWGDAVNLASRLESASAPGRILVCPTCAAALSTAFELEQRGTIEIKGVGAQDTWFLVARRAAEPALSPSSAAH